MINNFQLLRSIGRFEAVTAPNIALGRLTLINADNGQGKTTLAAILRSLATAEPLHINERRRLSAQQAPHIVINCSGGPPPAIFQNGAWNRHLSDMMVFDDAFVDENVYSGLVVGPGHRQNLHELILGAQGVALNRQLQQLVAQIETHNTNLRQRAAPITQAMRGPFEIDEFCNLPVEANILQQIDEAQRALAAKREQDAVRSTEAFASIPIPTFDLPAIQRVLEAGLPDVDADALARVQAHLATAGRNAEDWVADGMRRQAASPTTEAVHCVFCAQDLAGSPVISHYRTYFSHAYQGLKRNISDAIGTLERHCGRNAQSGFERAVRFQSDRYTFWSRFCQLTAISIQFDEIVENWRMACDGLTALLEAKRAAPLDRVAVPENIANAVAAHEAYRTQVLARNQQLESENQTIAGVKERAAAANATTLTANLARLEAIHHRHSLATSSLCAAYLAEKAAKTATEAQREQARQALEQYRANIFPSYEAAINRYLARFNATFLLSSVIATNTRGGATCTYNVVINNVPVAVAGGIPQRGEHSFRNTLSAGDRNALALAFFFASLELDSQLFNRIVVIDDPVSSLDGHRTVTTVQEIRRLADRVAQVIVLSHNKPFLCEIWKGSDPGIRVALHIPRQGNGSVIESWNVDQDCVTEHDKRHEALREFHANGGPNEREVAQSLRPSIEAFLRVSFPQHFPPGRMLGPFRGICLQALNTPNQMLNQNDIQELEDLTEYANRFHHDTNPGWQAVQINATELRGFVGRALAFIRRA